MEREMIHGPKKIILKEGTTKLPCQTKGRNHLYYIYMCVYIYLFSYHLFVHVDPFTTFKA